MTETYIAKIDRRETCHHIRGVDYLINEWGDETQPQLFYLHGWGDCAATFQFVVDQLRKGWHVIAPDWRGFGGSKLRATSYWFPDYLADLDQILSIYAGENPVSVVGHSMGANVAGLYAGAMPDRVSRFVNVEGFGLANVDPDKAPERYRDWLLKSRQEPGFRSFPDHESLARHILQRSPKMTMPQALFVARSWAEPGPDGLELRTDPAHKLPNPVLYRRQEAEACWSAVTADVLLVGGSDSVFMKAGDPRLGVGSLQLPFPKQQQAVIDGVGHMIHYEAPGRLAELIEDFLQPL